MNKYYVAYTYNDGFGIVYGNIVVRPPHKSLNTYTICYIMEEIKEDLKNDTPVVILNIMKLDEE